MTRLLERLRTWWDGRSDPKAQYEAQRIREDVGTVRVGGDSSTGNLTHRGKDSRRGF